MKRAGSQSRIAAAALEAGGVYASSPEKDVGGRALSPGFAAPAAGVPAMAEMSRSKASARALSPEEKHKQSLRQLQVRAHGSSYASCCRGVGLRDMDLTFAFALPFVVGVSD